VLEKLSLAGREMLNRSLSAAVGTAAAVATPVAAPAPGAAPVPVPVAAPVAAPAAPAAARAGAGAGAGPDADGESPLKRARTRGPEESEEAVTALLSRFADTPLDSLSAEEGMQRVLLLVRPLMPQCAF
jgi:hypothetical protein